MSKSQTTIILTLLLLLTAFNGFLAWQWGSFRTEYNLLVTRNQSQGVENGKLVERVKALEDELKKQQAVAEEFKTMLAKLPDKLAADFDKRFLRQPEYVAKVPLFTVGDSGGGVFKVVGRLAELDKWQDRNKLFLDDIIQESVALDYDPAKQGVTVTDLVKDSVYYQMGLRQGDVIKSADGRQALSGDEVRVSLVAFQPLKVEISRGGEKVVLDISYANQ